MPPFPPKPNQAEDDAQSTSGVGSASVLETSGPAARQRIFVEERLVGMGQPSIVVAVDAVAESTPAGDSSPRAMAMAATVPQDNLATERRRSLADFRTRQLAQNSRVALPGQPPSPLAAMSRDLPAASAQEAWPTDFLQTNRWLLLGPAVVRDGQSGQQSAMSGRVRDIAVAPGGERLYVATANGGIWRSEDGGRSWLSLMDAFDLNPSLYRADSLACGAMALVPGQWAGEDIIYVGSGEPGVTPWLQGDSAYFGVGPIVSTDGGLTWVTESSEPSLAGSAFYAMAVDPVWPQRVVAATLRGLYCRKLDDAGVAHWIQQKDGYFCSVVVSHRNNYTIFYAAEWGGPVWYSTDGESWAPLGSGFPNENVGRIGLAVQADHPEILYALVANSNDHLLGLYRLDRADNRWRLLKGVPPTLFGPSLNRRGQGGYDLAMAIDPFDVNRVYLGGSIVYSDGIQPSANFGDWSGALYRCEVEIHPTTKSGRVRTTYIGGSIHGDLHAIRHAPGDADKLWVGCDGGIFFSAAPKADPQDPSHATGLFFPCNTGLATLTMNYLGLHPTEEAVLFCGTQDNGGLRYTGDPVWLYSSGGDSGYFVIDWHNPYQVVTTYIQNQILRSLDGGMRYSYSGVHVLPANAESAQFYAPIAGTPYAPEEPETASRIAFGGERVWLSDHLGGDGVQWNGSNWIGEVDWVSLPNNDPVTDLVEGVVETLIFASATKLYAGTTAGRIYRYALSGNQWQRHLLPVIANDQVAAYVGTITSIAIDPADGSGNALYITLGGFENPHRVWYFDGIQWEPRSGPAATTNDEPGLDQQRLLDVQHNAIVVDPQQPAHLYVAADIGIWRSTDSGRSWRVFARGLPDAAVIDLKLHEPSRLLRAATHGRGVYEFDLGRPQRSVDLYIRDHQLDLGRYPAVTGALDPVHYGNLVQPGQSPDIKFDPPDANGRYQLAGANPRYTTPFPPRHAPESAVDFYTFATKLDGDMTYVMTHSRANVQTQIYVQVHNRGLTTANNVRVMLLLARTTRDQGQEMPLLPPLPTDYEAQIRAGQPIASDDWQTVGFATVHDVRAGHPQIASFVLGADCLPTPGLLRDNMTFSLVAIVHSAADPFTAEASTSLTPGNNRHVAHRWVEVLTFAGALPNDTARRRPQKPRPNDFLAEHRVRRGETLSYIAKHYYNSARQWPEIYSANRQLIGPDPNLLKPGIVLRIPYI